MFEMTRLFVALLLFLFVFAQQESIPFVNIDEIRRSSSSSASSLGAGAGAACPNVKGFYLRNVTQRPEISTMLAQFDSLLNLVFAQSQVALGATAMHASIVFYNETIYSRGFGVRRFDTTPNSPPDENTIFRIGSVSKLFAALLTFIANDRNIIHSLDDAVSDYVPEVSLFYFFGFDSLKNHKQLF